MVQLFEAEYGGTFLQLRRFWGRAVDWWAPPHHLIIPSAKGEAEDQAAGGEAKGEAEGEAPEIRSLRARWVRVMPENARTLWSALPVS